MAMASSSRWAIMGPCMGPAWVPALMGLFPWACAPPSARQVGGEYLVYVDTLQALPAGSFVPSASKPASQQQGHPPGLPRAGGRSADLRASGGWGMRIGTCGQPTADTPRRDGADGIADKAFIEAACTHEPKCCFWDAAWGLQVIPPHMAGRPRCHSGCWWSDGGGGGEVGRWWRGGGGRWEVGRWG